MRSILAALAAACCTLPAQAEILTFEYTADITRLVVNDYFSDAFDVSSTSLTPQPLAIGDRVTGRFIIDTAPRDIRYFNNLDVTNYGVSPTSTAPSITFNDSWGWAGVQQTGYYDVTNAKNYETFDRFNVVHSLDYYGPQVAITLTDSSATVFSHRGPPTDLDLADFDKAQVYVSYGATPAAGSFTHLGMYATLTGLQRVTPVPEPETYAMLLAGLAVVAGARRRAAKAS